MNNMLFAVCIAREARNVMQVPNLSRMALTTEPTVPAPTRELRAKIFKFFVEHEARTGSLRKVCKKIQTLCKSPENAKYHLCDDEVWEMACMVLGEPPQTTRRRYDKAHFLRLCDEINELEDFEFEAAEDPWRGYSDEPSHPFYWFGAGEAENVRTCHEELIKQLYEERRSTFYIYRLLVDAILTLRRRSYTDDLGDLGNFESLMQMFIAQLSYQHRTSQLFFKDDDGFVLGFIELAMFGEEYMKANGGGGRGVNYDGEAEWNSYCNALDERLLKSVRMKDVSGVRSALYDGASLEYAKRDLDLCRHGCRLTAYDVAKWGDANREDKPTRKLTQDELEIVKLLLDAGMPVDVFNRTVRVLRPLEQNDVHWLELVLETQREFREIYSRDKLRWKGNESVDLMAEKSLHVDRVPVDKPADEDEIALRAFLRKRVEGFAKAAIQQAIKVVLSTGNAWPLTMLRREGFPVKDFVREGESTTNPPGQWVWIPSDAK